MKMKSKKLLKTSKSKTKYNNLKGGGQYNNDTLKITDGVFEIDSQFLPQVEKKLVKLNVELLGNSNQITKIMMSSIMVHFEPGKKKELYVNMFNALKKNTNVNEINFNSNYIGDDICKELAKLLEVNKSITSINLEFNDITNVGAEELAKALQTNTTLTTIDFYGNISKKNNIEGIKAVLSEKSGVLPGLFIPNNPLVAIPADDATKQNIEFIKNKISSETSNNKYFQSKIEELFTSEELFNDLIKKNYYAGRNKIAELRNINDNNVKVVVNLHGVIQSKIFKLPDNVNVVFMSPVSYISCPSGSLVDYLNDNNNLHNFLENPSCFNKNKVNEKFNQSVIFYGGQYCIDLLMGRGYPGDQGLSGPETSTGINIYDNKTGLFIVKSKTPEVYTKTEETAFYKLGIPTKPNLSYDKFPSSLENGVVHLPFKVENKDDKNAFLSNFLTHFFSNSSNNKKQFTIFFGSCREMDNQSNKETLSFYEKIIKYLNFKIHYDYVSNNNTKAIDINTAYQNCFLTSTIFSNKTTMSHGQKRKSKEQLKLNKINTKIKSKSRIKPVIDDESIIELSSSKSELSELSDLFNNKTQITLKELKDFIITSGKNNTDIFNLLFILLSSIFKKYIFEYDPNFFDYRQLDFIELTKYILNGINKTPSEIFEFIIYFANTLELKTTSYIDLVNLFIDKTPELKSSAIETILERNNQNIMFSDIIIDNNRKNVGFNPELGINPFTSGSTLLENPLVIARKAEASRKAKEEAARKAKEETERKAKEEAVRKAKEEAARKAKEAEAARKAKEAEAARKAKEAEAARKAKEEAEAQAKVQTQAPVPVPVRLLKFVPPPPKRTITQKANVNYPEKNNIPPLVDRALKPVNKTTQSSRVANLMKRFQIPIQPTFQV